MTKVPSIADMDGTFSVFSTFIVRIHAISVILLLEYSFNFKGVLAVVILALLVDQRVIDIDSRRFDVEIHQIMMGE